MAPPIFFYTTFLVCGEGKKKAEIYTDVAISRDKRDLYRIKREEPKASEG